MLADWQDEMLDDEILDETLTDWQDEMPDDALLGE